MGQAQNKIPDLKKYCFNDFYADLIEVFGKLLSPTPNYEQTFHKSSVLLLLHPKNVLFLKIKAFSGYYVNSIESLEATKKIEIYEPLSPLFKSILKIIDTCKVLQQMNQMEKEQLLYKDMNSNCVREDFVDECVTVCIMAQQDVNADIALLHAETLLKNGQTNIGFNVVSKLISSTEQLSDASSDT